MNTKNLKLRKHNKYLLKGEPGSGKSIAAASFPEVYTFDLDKRIRSIAAFYPHKDFEYGWFSKFVQIDEKLDSLMSHCPYQTILYDGLTATAEILIRDMINFRPMNPKTTRAGVRMTEIEDFGGEQRGLDHILNKLFLIQEKHEVNVIVTAHVIEVEKTLKGGITIKSRSLLTAGKKVAAFLPVHFDERYHFQVNEPIETGGIPRFECVTRHTGEDWASTTYNIDPVIDFTNKNFYEELMKSRIEHGDIEKVQVDNPFGDNIIPDGKP